MSLVLSLAEGQDFYVGDRQFFIDEIYDARRFYLREPGVPGRVEITDREATEIAPKVKASSGAYFEYGLIRIALDAPRDILILRGDRLRKPTGEGH